MDPFLSYTRAKQPEIIALIKILVECESPSDHAPSVNRFVELFVDSLRGIAQCRTFPGGKFGKNLRCEFTLAGSASAKKKADGIVLGLGHSDTVWPLGTLASMPFLEEKGRLWGPGVLDMKAGLVFFVYAVKALRELDIPVARKVVLQVNSDEEVGSDVSRALTEEAAKQSAAVLVLEPGTGMTGKLKTARKGVGDYMVRVRGKASHAGVDFSNGASAIVEISRQIQKIAAFTDLVKGITVNPGVVQGGTRSNVVAAEASAHVDFRVPRRKDAAWIERQFGKLKAFDERCEVTIEGGLNRPPMERSAGARRLYVIAEKLAAEVGVDLEESMTGGGSDGNFTAALGVPTLDGLGAVGEGAHAVNESLLVNRIADRTALLAKLIAAI